MNSIVISDNQGYLIIDNNFKLVNLSPNVKKYAESPETLAIGQDIRSNFPELIGLEDTLISLGPSSEESFILNGIAREQSSGSNSYFNLTIKKNGNNLILFLEDVTELMLLRQSLNQKINESEITLNELKRFEYCTNKIVDSMGDILLITDSSGVINRANEAIKNILGYSSSEVLNRHITEIIDDPKFDYDRVFKSLESFKPSLPDVEIEVHISEPTTLTRVVTNRNYGASSYDHFITFSSHKAEFKSRVIDIVKSVTKGGREMDAALKMVHSHFGGRNWRSTAGGHTHQPIELRW